MASLWSVPRELVVVEIGTGTWCQYCPGAAMGAHDLLANNPPVASFKHHNGDSYANTYSNARNSYYGITGYPTALFDGQNALVGGSATQSMYNSYLPRVSSRMAVASAYTLSAIAAGTGTNYQITVHVAKPEADTNTNVVLRASLTQSNIAQTWFNQTEVDNVNRRLMPDQNGTPISLATGGSTNVTLNLSTQASWPLQDLELVIWLQNNSTKEILQGKKYSLLAMLTDSEVTIGAGDQQGRIPVDMYWKNSLFECLYYQGELGFSSGTINGVKFYNNFISDLPNMPVNIWLGTTAQTAFAPNGWIPSGQLTQVFNGVANFPVGANTIQINFSTPFQYTGGTLVMMVNRPMDTQYYSSSDNFYVQTVGTARALKAYSDNTLFDPAVPPTAGVTLSGQFPKTTFMYTGQAMLNDLAAVSVTGNPTPSAQSASNYVITVHNNGALTQSNYQVKLMQEGNIELGSVSGTAIPSQTDATFAIPWTPTTAGPTYLFAKVVLANDEVAQNDISPNLNVLVQPAGVVAVTVGEGGGTARMPMDMYYKNSLFEAVYLSSELNIGGQLTGVQFYNNFVTDLPNMPTKIWVGETTQTDLATDWIPSTQLTQVFDGTVNYPTGINSINIQFSTPYSYGGGNLVMMVKRPMDTIYYSSSDVFVAQAGTIAARTRNIYGDSVDYDPAAPAADTPEATFPKTTFFFITEGMGELRGIVTSGGSPVAGATVSITNTNHATLTAADGTYSFPYVAEGTYTAHATKHGYNLVAYTVTIVENQTTTRNFTITPLAQVTVSGRIVGSDAPTWDYPVPRLL